MPGEGFMPPRLMPPGPMPLTDGLPMPGPPMPPWPMLPVCGLFVPPIPTMFCRASNYEVSTAKVRI
eukprot:scaffold22151_cov38-Prasinocladus_malaysianus.AAC.1